MSQWTHFLGVVRYDSFNMNVWPEPPNKDDAVQDELKLVSNLWQRDLPMGSEGPIEVKTYNTSRGATVLITGDLRDFGLSDLDEVVTWANESSKAVEKAASVRRSILFIRDAFINCDVEYDDALYVIQPNIDTDSLHRFVLNKYSREAGRGEGI